MLTHVRHAAHDFHSLALCNKIDQKALNRLFTLLSLSRLYGVKGLHVLDDVLNVCTQLPHPPGCLILTLPHLGKQTPRFPEVSTHLTIFFEQCQLGRSRISGLRRRSIRNGIEW